jgi:hypothetical protein
LDCIVPEQSYEGSTSSIIVERERLVNTGERPRKEGVISRSFWVSSHESLIVEDS